MTTLGAKLRSLAVLVACFAFFNHSALGASVDPPICEEVCSDSSCESTCYLNLMEFENGNDITCYDYGDYDLDQFCCGDGFCGVDAGETGYCESDCPTAEPPMYPCTECDFEAQDCAGYNTVCTASQCCVELCDGGSCGEHQRTCIAGDTCYSLGGSECCPDEYCAVQLHVPRCAPRGRVIG